MISPALLKYVEQHSTEEDDLLYQLRRETHLKTVYPQMLSGQVLGKFLELLSRLTRPDSILEIGTFTGYSAICLARGLSRDGKLHTIDSNTELLEMQNRYFLEAGLQDKIIQHTGDALDILAQMQDSYDLVFMDAAKDDYPEYYRLIIDRVRPGGLILADNTLWGGKVLEPKESMDKETKGVSLFNKMVTEDKRVENVLLPVRDGIMLVVKL